jgi:hypothetical protein
MEVTTDHPNLSQSVPTDDNLDNLNGNDSGITSPVVVESISTQSLADNFYRYIELYYLIQFP